MHNIAREIINSGRSELNRNFHHLARETPKEEEGARVRTSRKKRGNSLKRSQEGGKKRDGEEGRLYALKCYVKRARDDTSDMQQQRCSDAVGELKAFACGFSLPSGSRLTIRSPKKRDREGSIYVLLAHSL